MKILMGSTLAAAAMSLCSTPALAEDGIHAYAGAGAVATIRDSAWLGSAQVKAGLQFNRYFAIEADYGRGTGGYPRVEKTYAGYLVGGVPAGSFDVFGRVGFGARVSRSKSYFGPTPNKIQFTLKEENLPVGGIGARYHFDEKNAFRIDLTRFGPSNADISLSYERSF